MTDPPPPLVMALEDRLPAADVVQLQELLSVISTASTLAMLALGPDLREKLTLESWFAAIVQAHDTLCVLLPWLPEHVPDWDWRALELDARAYLARLREDGAGEQ